MLADLLDDYKRRQVRDLKNSSYMIRKLVQYFGDMQVDALTEGKVNRFIDDLLRQDLTRTTVNRYTQILKQALKRAHRKKYITEIPYIERFSEKGNARQGFFEYHEVEAILSHMPEHWHDIVWFAYYTGWRKREVLTLQWQNVQGDTVRLWADASKNEEPRVIVLAGPLAPVAAIIERRQAARLDGVPWVFHRQGRQLVAYDKSWRKARKLAGLPQKIFHDTRRTAARNLEEVGVSRQVAKLITGHKTDSMHLRYLIRNERDMRREFGKLGHSTPTPNGQDRKE
jgi:integrase